LSDAPAIALRDVRFERDGQVVLDTVDLEIATGSFASVIGPNGGGKSTLMKLLLGLLEPTHGSVEILGRPPARARRMIGYMPQHQQIDPLFPITVDEVVRLGGLDSRSLIGRIDRSGVEDALVAVGCQHLRQKSFGSLSGGQRQLVLIARALVARPRILLLDEPTANLDPGVEESFYELLQRLRGDMTILLVSHDVGLVSEQTEHVVCVNQKVVTHRAHEVTTEIIQEMFGGSGAKIVDHGHDHHAHTERGEPHPS